VAEKKKQGGRERKDPATSSDGVKGNVYQKKKEKVSKQETRNEKRDSRDGYGEQGERTDCELCGRGRGFKNGEKNSRDTKILLCRQKMKKSGGKGYRRGGEVDPSARDCN